MDAVSDEPLPNFDGAFRVQWDEEYGNCLLIIEGSYEPPLGTVGRIFDAAAGRKIAQRTLENLLDSLRTVIETSYQKDTRKPEQ